MKAAHSFAPLPTIRLGQEFTSDAFMAISIPRRTLTSSVLRLLLFLCSYTHVSNEQKHRDDIVWQLEQSRTAHAGRSELTRSASFRGRLHGCHLLDERKLLRSCPQSKLTRRGAWYRSSSLRMAALTAGISLPC